MVGLLTLLYDKTVTFQSSFFDSCFQRIHLGISDQNAALLDQTAVLKPEHFSSQLLGGVYGQFLRRHREGLEVNLSGLELSGDEMSHIAGIAQRQTGPVSEQALADCVRTILAEHSKSGISSADDLMAIREKMKNRKGIRQ